MRCPLPISVSLSLPLSLFLPLLPHSFRLPPSRSLSCTLAHIFLFLPCEHIARKTATYKSGRELSSGTELLSTLISYFPASRAVRNKYVLFKPIYGILVGFPGNTVVKNPPANAGGLGDKDSIPGEGRSPGEGTDNVLQYSCLENPMDRGTWRPTVCGVAKSQMQLGTHTWYLAMAAPKSTKTHTH